MRRQKLVKGGEESAIDLTSAGEAWCARLGIDLEALRAGRRPLCRPCLDWSERRLHLAGALGAVLLDRLVALRSLRRTPDSRVVTVSPRGARFIEELR